MLFLQMWQESEGDALAECDQIIAPLALDNPKLCSAFEAAKALRAGNADAAIEALDKAKDETDVTWLQLRANALAQKRQLADAAECLLIAARSTGDPAILHKTADLAFQSESTGVAVWCYERLVQLLPTNMDYRGRLAHIYTSRLHDTGKAAIHLRALYEAEPDNPVHIVNLAVCLAQLYLPEESLRLYDKACGQDKPDIRAVLGRAELHMSLGNPDAALASLRAFHQRFRSDPTYLMVFMNTAYAAGDEEAAHESLKTLDQLHECGGVDPSTFMRIPEDKVFETLKKRIEHVQKRTEYLHTEMLKGRMPWLYAEQVCGNPAYAGWNRRTRQLTWIHDDPVNRASLCVYATNAFHPGKTDVNHRGLLPLECPPQGTRIMADMSALITLHRLELLDTAAEYFGDIGVPEEYLSTVLEDGRRLILHQRWLQRSAEHLAAKIDSRAVTVLEKQNVLDVNMATVNEHGEPKEHHYHLIDLIRPCYRAGLIPDTVYQQVLKVRKEESAVDEAHPDLGRLQCVLVALSTLEMVAHFGLLDAITEHYRVHILPDVHTEIRQRLESIQHQEETRRWHFNLWNRLRADPRFHFVSRARPEEKQESDADPKDLLPFLASFIAQETATPLLADDRMCQALTLNERPEAAYAAFGTGAFISGIMMAGKITTARAAECIQRLMRWRYRFVVPSADILKTLAGQYCANAPGQALQDVSEYVHECMRDPGLFGGPENTDSHESMAVRLYREWLSVISEFLISVWDDKSFPVESAQRLTQWSVQELLPSPPRVLHGSMKAKVASLTPRLLLSHSLITGSVGQEGERISDGMRAMQDALGFSDEEYLREVADLLKLHQECGFGPEDADGMKQQMRILIYRTALRHHSRVDARTVRILEDLGLFKDEAGSIGDDVDISVLQDLGHPRREKLPAGPLVVYVTEEEKPCRRAAELPFLLLSERQNVCKAAMDCLEQMIQNTSLSVTPRTEAILRESRNALTSADLREWRPAAVASFDAISDDVLVALQGVRQSLECQPAIEDSLNYYVPKVLRPAVSSLDSIRLEIGSPEKEHDQMSRVIALIVGQAQTLTDVCEGCRRQLGFLPLAPRYGMPEAVRGWLSTHADTDAWTEIWDWVDASVSPIPQYHACCVFALHPELVPPGKVPILWDRILRIVCTSDSEGRNKAGAEAWAIRCDLARHYAYHLEASLPDGNGANIACLAWWLAEAVASSCSDEPDAPQFYRRNWVKPALEASTRIWLMASPHIQRSYLRYMTLAVPSPWAVGLLSIMGDKLQQLAPRTNRGCPGKVP